MKQMHSSLGTLEDETPIFMALYIFTFLQCDIFSSFLDEMHIHLKIFFEQIVLFKFRIRLHYS